MTKQHIRTLLRERAADALRGLPSTGDRVFLGRQFPIVEAQMPCILVHAAGGPIEAATPDSVDRFPVLAIVALIAEGADYEDRLDEIAAEIEGALERDLSLGGLCGALYLEEDEIAPDENEESEQRFARLVMTYRAAIRTPRGAPTISMNA